MSSFETNVRLNNTCRPIDKLPDKVNVKHSNTKSFVAKNFSQQRLGQQFHTVVILLTAVVFHVELRSRLLRSDVTDNCIVVTMDYAK